MLGSALEKSLKLTLFGFVALPITNYVSLIRNSHYCTNIKSIAGQLQLYGSDIFSQNIHNKVSENVFVMNILNNLYIFS